MGWWRVLDYAVIPALERDRGEVLSLLLLQIFNEGCEYGIFDVIVTS